MSSRLFCNPASNAVALSLAATRPARLRKGLILAATMLLWVPNLLAQLPGTVHFANQTSSAISNELAGRPVALADDIRAALYWAPLGASVFKQIGPSVSVGIPAPGLYLGGTRTTGPQTPAGTPGQFRVRAWPGIYATYEIALTHTGILIGQSPVFTNQTGTPQGGLPFPPYPLAAGGVSGFNVTPNPPVLTPPTLTCATNKTVSCTNAWSFDPPAALDGCTGANLPVWPVATRTNFFGCSNVMVQTWAATNTCNGLSATCSQSVTVLGIGPTIVCPTNMVLNTCDASLPVSWTVLATNPCGPVSVTSAPPSGTVFLPNTTNTVLCTASDDCGNTNTCMFTVTILRPSLGALTITGSGGSVMLHWMDGILEHADGVLGPWADVPGAMSPGYSVAPLAQKFYRLRCDSP